MGKTYILPVFFDNEKEIMMRIEDFKRLPEHEQLSIIFNKANFVDSTEKGSTVFVLYSMRTFFIELEYDAFNFRISTPRAFESDKRLNKYLNWEKAL